MSEKSKLSVINTKTWIQQNEDKFKPPVCNKLMHNNQLTIMFVGGKNIREDYHIEEGEELFYQVKGDISVKILENGQHKEIFIKEGEIFLLPARIPHSPQRPENTIGLVIERNRSVTEIDGIRWFIPNSTTPLYEKWFYCTDLGVQLAPVIKEYFASEEYKTKIPTKEHVLEELPFKLNSIQVNSEEHGPYRLNEKIEMINAINNQINLTPSKMNMQFNIEVFSKGEHKIENFDQNGYDCWVWQLEGECTIKLGNDCFILHEKDSLLVPANYSDKICFSVLSGNLLKVIQDPRLK